jgi:hypothetical protein
LCYVPRNLAEASLRIPTPGERLRAHRRQICKSEVRFSFLAPLQEKDQHRESGDPEHPL